MLNVRQCVEGSVCVGFRVCAPREETEVPALRDIVEGPPRLTPTCTITDECTIKDSGFRVEGLWLRVQGLGFRVSY